MAVGYECKFMDSVPEDFYCKQCSLVARRLTITSCCGESYCNACIQQDRPCPGCEARDFQTQQQMKHQKKILTFRVCCSMKARGCGWCGLLEHLDAHLDPNTGDCEYTDIDCPLNCHSKINKKNISDHLAKECVKRDYICSYCSFKATYEIVSNIHWPECSYFPLTCPNRCGVTCERTTMEEDHMKICPLQEVECQLKHIGCAERFPREEEEEHMREKAQTHLLMMAATSVKMSQDFQGKLREQDRKLQEQERMLQEQEIKSQEQEKKSQNQARKSQEQKWKLQEQERKSLEQEEMLQEQERKIYEQERKLQEQERKLYEQQRKSQEQERKSQEQERKSQEQERKLQEQERSAHERTAYYETFIKTTESRLRAYETELEDTRRCGIPWSFLMDNFSENKARDKVSNWKSPPMYTHTRGYKFCIGVDANGSGSWRNQGVTVVLWATRGEYDDGLKWPVTAKFTVVLVNHFVENGVNKTFTCIKSWDKPQQEYSLIARNHFIRHAELPYNGATRTHFLCKNTLHLKVNEITLV